MRYFLLLFFPLTAWSAEIDFEHSFAFGEGSLWGTEDSLQKRIEVSDHELPKIFKIPSNSSLASIGRTDLNRNPNGYFIGGKAVVYPRLRICYDKNSPLPHKELTAALDKFRLQVTGPQSSHVSFEISEAIVDDIQQTKNCDVFFKKGSWQEYPYDRLSFLRSTTSWRNQVFAIYYRNNLNSLPVVTIHPEIQIGYLPTGRYLTVEGDNLLIDGRGLVLHELGHVIGFSHLPLNADTAGELSLMSLSNKDPVYNDLELRFLKSFRIWEAWNFIQISTYRRLLLEEDLSNPAPPRPICLMVGESFELSTPTEGLPARRYGAQWIPASELDFVKVENYGTPLLKNTFFSERLGLLYTLDQAPESIQLLGIELQYLDQQSRAVFKFVGKTSDLRIHLFLGSFRYGPMARGPRDFVLSSPNYYFSFKKELFKDPVKRFSCL